MLIGFSCFNILFVLLGMKYLHFDVPGQVVIHGDLKSKNGMAASLFPAQLGLGVSQWRACKYDVTCTPSIYLLDIHKILALAGQ